MALHPGLKRLRAISIEKGVVGFDWRVARLPIAFAILPLLYLIWMCVRLHVDVPFGDQWELVPRLNRLDAGTLSFFDLWRQHNEHRLVFPILAMLGLAWITDWSIGAEIALNVALGIAIFAVYVAALGSIYRDLPAWRWWLLPILSLLLFSPAQWENWLWGWQMQVFMCVLGSVVGFWLLSGPDRGGSRYGAALLCGVFSMYSLAAGLTYWLIGPVALLVNTDQKTFRRLAIWAVVAAVMIGTYFIDYHRVPGSAPLLSNFGSLNAVAKLVLYTFKYLGAPVAGYSRTAAWPAGVAGLALLGLLLVATWRSRRTSAVIFPCLIAFNAVADAGMTALGRAALGTDQAMASRYQTVGAQFWVAILLLSAVVIGQRAARGRRSWWNTSAPMGIAAALCLSIALNGAYGLRWANGRMNVLRTLRVDLRNGTHWQDVSHLYLGDVPSIRERAAVLRMLRMSVYRDGAE